MNDIFTKLIDAIIKSYIIYKEVLELNEEQIRLRLDRELTFLTPMIAKQLIESTMERMSKETRKLFNPTNKTNVEKVRKYFKANPNVTDNELNKFVDSLDPNDSIDPNGSCNNIVDHFKLNENDSIEFPIFCNENHLCESCQGEV
jgi:hypothetical protein